MALDLNNLKRPKFLKHAKYLAIKPVRISYKTVLRPGDPIPFTRVTQLRRLYLKNFIGLAGHQWTVEQIRKYKKKKAQINRANKVLYERTDSLPTASLRDLPQIGQVDQSIILGATEGVRQNLLKENIDDVVERTPKKRNNPNKGKKKKGGKK